MKIVKRNGQLVEFSQDKIERAIGLALGESNERIVWGDYEVLVDTIRQNVTDGMSVEQVSDIIEMELMRSGLFVTAKRYIIWRSEKATERSLKRKGVQNLLTDEFISKYKHVKPPMTQLGELVYYRTYSRHIPELGRREHWYETVRRAVEYNCSLIPTTRLEAEELFDNVFNLRQFLSGRTFWVGGTDVATKFPMSNYNCSFQVINEVEAFRDVFYLLLIGSGAGVRILKSDVVDLPKFRTDIDVIHQTYRGVAKNLRHESTSIIFDQDNTAKVIIGDSKDAWSSALDYFLRLLSSNEYKYIERIILVYDNIRPKGERLETFGGTASGHGALMSMFNKIDKVIKKYSHEKLHKLQPIDCLDIVNVIGEGVVVGGVRRTSEMILFDSDDKEVLDAKSKLYENVDGAWSVNQEIIHRQMSNNSVFYKAKPIRQAWHEQIEKMRYSGEPKSGLC